jgi:phosphoribosylformylglycinamidine (FGAM) synthase-like enzyme
MPIATLSAVGATPLAITNCLNFANPQRPEIMAQIVRLLDGMADACRAFDFPIVSRATSRFTMNPRQLAAAVKAEFSGPTPAIGGRSPHVDLGEERAR